MTIWQIADQAGIVQAIVVGFFALVILILGMRNCYRSVWIFLYSAFTTWLLLAVLSYQTAQFLGTYPWFGMVAVVPMNLFAVLIAILIGSVGAKKKKS